MTTSRPRARALRARLAARRASADGESGLTLIEMVVALFLVTMVLTSFVGVSIAGATASRASEARSRANQVGNQEVETFKSIPWDSLGLYDNDTTTAGASPSATCGSEPVTSLGATAPTPRVAPAFQRTANINGRDYLITNCITWRDDSADGTVAAGNELNSDNGHDVKHLVTTVSWTLLNKTRTITFDSLRSPNPAEVPPVDHSTVTLAITAGTPSPASQQLAADSTLTSPLTLSASTSLTATAVTVTYTGQAGSVTTSMTTSDSGATWSLTIPAGLTGGKFNAGTLTVTYQAASGYGSAQTTNTVTLTAPPTPFTVTATASPTSVFLDTSGYLTAAITLNVTTSLAATLVTVSYPLATGTGSKTLVNQGGGTSWQYVFVSGSASGQFAATSGELFTVTATNASGSVNGTTSVVLAPAAAQPVTFVSGVLPYSSSSNTNGQICVDKNGGRLTFAAETLTVTINNILSSDQATLTWTSDAGSATPATRATSGSGAIFTFTIPSGSHFTGTSSTFTIVAKRLSDNAGMTQVLTIPVEAPTKASSC